MHFVPLLYILPGILQSSAIMSLSRITRHKAIGKEEKRINVVY